MSSPNSARTSENPFDRRLGEIETHDDVTLCHQGRAQLLASLHDAHDRAGQVDGIGLHHSGVLGGLPAQQGAPGDGTCRSHRFDDGPVARRVQGADGQVVDESEGSRPDRGEVVDTHGNEVLAHSIPATGPPRQLQLRSHPVGRHHQHGLAVAGGNGDAGREAAEAADDVFGPGGGHRIGDSLDVAVGAFQVYPGLPVGGHSGALELELVCCLRDLGRVVAGETSRAEPGIGDSGRIEQALQ